MTTHRKDILLLDCWLDLADLWVDVLIYRVSGQYTAAKQIEIIMRASILNTRFHQLRAIPTTD